MRNKYGFTLVELLVVIVILGVITGISIPLLRNVQESNKYRQYTTYADSLKQSAKLYIDSYGDDIFGKRASGCGYVSYADMKERGYIKDINLEDMSCNSDNTFVKVVKMDNKYIYTPYLGCGTRVNDKANNITYVYPEAAQAYEMDTNLCNMNGSSMVVSMGKATVGSTLKRQTATVMITSPTGIGSDAVIYAAWSKNKNFDSITSWTKANISIPTGQNGKINAGELISAESQDFQTPAGENGEYFLLVKVQTLDDLYGAHWRNTQTANSPYLYFGPVNVDNTNPTCKLQVTANGVSFDTRNDNIGVKDFGMGNTNSANYNSTEVMTLGNGNFYGFVRDTAGNVGSCSAVVGGVNVKYTKKSKTCNGTQATASGSYAEYRFISTSYAHTTDLSACYALARAMNTIGNSPCTAETSGKTSATCDQYYYTQQGGLLEYRVTRRTCGPYYLSCTTATCSKTGCSCTNASYSFGTETTQTNVTSCTENIFTCNASNSGSTYVSCTPTEYTCANTGYTKLNNTYCFKIN